VEPKDKIHGISHGLSLSPYIYVYYVYVFHVFFSFEDGASKFLQNIGNFMSYAKVTGIFF
jgi:hypothetical protein